MAVSNFKKPNGCTKNNIMTIKDKIKEHKEVGFTIKQELIEAIKPFIKDNWYYYPDFSFKDVWGNELRGISNRSEVLYFQNENASEYSLLSFSIDNLLEVLDVVSSV